MKIPSIKGPECVHFLTQKLLHFRGVDHLIVDVNTKTLRLIYDANRSSETAVRQVLRDIGYPSEQDLI